MIFPIRKHYFSSKVNIEVKEIYINAFIVNLAISITTLFEPIFLYGLGYTLYQIMWFYAMVYLWYAILVFPAAKIISKIGYKHAIFFSNICYIIYWVMLYQMKFDTIWILIAPIFFAMQKSFFWPPYHADIALNSAGNQRGREVGVLFALIQIAAIAGPFIGGAITTIAGFKFMFIFSSVLMLLSAYPLFRSSEIYPKHTFHFRNFWIILRKYPRNFFAYWGYAEDLMLMSLWPIYVFAVVPELLDLGFLVTFASFIAIVIMLYIGKLADVLKKGKLRWLLEISSVIYGLTWLFRQFALNYTSIFVFDALTRTSKAAVNVPLTDISYKIAGSKTADHAIAYSVFYEFSLAIGKIAMALMAMWILQVTGNIYHIFMVAGILTMFYGYLRKK